MVERTAILPGVRAYANGYYEEPEYLQDVAALQRILEDVRGRTIGVDLEATLVTDCLNKAPFAGKLGLVPFAQLKRFADMKFLRRPLSGEILHILWENGNAVRIVTSANIKTAEAIIREAELDVPEGMPIFCREDIKAAVSELKLQNLLTASGNTDAELELNLLEGQRKMPRMFELDALVDDSDEHQEFCKTVKEPDEARKIIPVRPFILTGMRNQPASPGELTLEDHFLDREILNVARELRARFGQA